MRLLLGDCLEVMGSLKENSVDAIVTDPPYGLGFMGKAWDGMPPGDETAKAMLRVLKPAHYLVAFGGTRTHHRLMVALEDAGFEIRDTLMWLYGSGFPKGKGNLKPAWEPIILCRKPGKGVRELGIEECRIGTEKTVTIRHGHSGDNGVYGQDNRTFTRENIGRWPANLILDETSAAMLDEQSGVSKSGVAVRSRSGGKTFGTDSLKPPMVDMTYADSGGASRFFYCAKASRSERNAGCEGLEKRDGKTLQVPARAFVDYDGQAHNTGGEKRYLPRANHHPTVKPVALMSWLIKLMSPLRGTVLDPFMGSGTTGVAAVQEGRFFIGIEREPEYLEIAKARIKHAENEHAARLEGFAEVAL